MAPGARLWLESIEAASTTAEEAEVAIAYLAVREVDLDEDELRGALRRALLLLATGGDPHRDIDREERAVRSLAADLDDVGRRNQLAAALESLRAEAGGLELVAASLDRLAADTDAGWGSLACALLAEEVAGEDDPPAVDLESGAP